MKTFTNSTLKNITTCCTTLFQLALWIAVSPLFPVIGLMWIFAYAEEPMEAPAAA